MANQLLDLKRWIHLDWCLTQGVHVKYFAWVWRVSVKRVQRDLKMFRDLGQRMRKYREPRETGLWTPDYKRKYADGIKPLFARNVPPKPKAAEPCNEPPKAPEPCNVPPSAPEPWHPRPRRKRGKGWGRTR